jgi:hypothetical protein
VGYGKVLTFFGPDGRVLASYTLEQLLPFDEIWEVPITMHLPVGEAAMPSFSFAKGKSNSPL